MDHLLSLLSDGQFHSGEEIASSLGISRTAVWKQIRRLQRLGLEVEAKKGRGYRLRSPLKLLSAREIASLQERPLPFLERLLVIDSTNRYLLARSEELPKGSAVLAEAQTSGRGRLGRRWVSPFGANLYLSFLWRFLGIERTAGLSLAVGVAALEALEGLGISGIGLKWPNDLVSEDRKLGGILIEARGEAHGQATVVVGIGINVAMPQGAARQIDQPWTDLRALTGKIVDRNLLAARMLDRLLLALERFEEEGFSPFRKAYRKRCVVLERPVLVVAGKERFPAFALDIDQMGALLVEVDGEVRRLSGGEVSLRS